jgi:hypothetical protein
VLVVLVRRARVPPHVLNVDEAHVIQQHHADVGDVVVRVPARPGALRAELTACRA